MAAQAKHVIYKYRISPLQQETFFEVPHGTRFISAISQGGVPTLYAEVDLQPDAEPETVKVTVIGTGNLILGNEGEFVDTVQVGNFVWHLFVAR